MVFGATKETFRANATIFGEPKATFGATIDAVVQWYLENYGIILGN